MQVKEIMSKNVEMVPWNSTVTEAARIMKSHNVGMLPVHRDREIIGVLTDRDIVLRALAEDMDPQKTMVDKILTPQCHCCSMNDPIEDAAKIMEDKQVRRLLVTDHNDQPIGVLSLCDIAVKSHDEHLTCEIVGKISEPAQLY